jgi:hypothetical protein
MVGMAGHRGFREEKTMRRSENLTKLSTPFEVLHEGAQELLAEVDPDDNTCAQAKQSIT